MNASRRPRFTIATALLVTALIAVSISHLQTSIQLFRVKAELTALRNDVTVLDADDESMIYAVALPTYGPLQWRWKIQLPRDGTYRLRYALDQIPESGLPQNSQAIDDAFLDSYAKPLQGGVPFTFDVGVFKDANDTWQFQTDNGPRGPRIPIRNHPAWLDEKTTVGWGSTVFGTNQTVSADRDSPLLLLRHRKSKTLPSGGITVDMAPTDGLLIWIERIPNPNATK